MLHHITTYSALNNGWLQDLAAKLCQGKPGSWQQFVESGPAMLAAVRDLIPHGCDAYRVMTGLVRILIMLLPYSCSVAPLVNTTYIDCTSLMQLRNHCQAWHAITPILDACIAQAVHHGSAAWHDEISAYQRP